MQMPILAQSGLSFLIYLIVGIFWLVGNLMQQKEAKRKAAELRKRREEREAEERRTGKKSTPVEPDPLERQLETFLGRLAGEPVKDSPSTPPPLPRKVDQKTAREPIRFDPQPPVSTTPRPRKTEPPKQTTSSPYKQVKRLAAIGELKYQDSYKEIGEMKEAAELDPSRLTGSIQSEAQALNNVHSMMIDLSSTTLSMPILRMESMRTVRTKTSRPNLKKDKNFKRAVAASVILEPPKALQAEPFKETP